MWLDWCFVLEYETCDWPKTWSVIITIVDKSSLASMHDGLDGWTRDSLHRDASRADKRSQYLIRGTTEVCIQIARHDDGLTHHKRRRLTCFTVSIAVMGNQFCRSFSMMIWRHIVTSLASLGECKLEADFMQCHAALGSVMRLTWKPVACNDKPARMRICGGTQAASAVSPVVCSVATSGDVVSAVVLRCIAVAMQLQWQCSACSAIAV